MNAITIAHLSDIHHNPDENSQISTLLREKGLLVEKLLDQCLETLKQRKPDIVLITGDMTHEGTSSHYRYLHDALSSALPGTPVFRRSTRKVPSFSSRHFFISFPASRFFLYLQQIFNALLGLFLLKKFF